MLTKSVILATGQHMTAYNLSGYVNQAGFLLLVHEVAKHCHLMVGVCRMVAQHRDQLPSLLEAPTALPPMQVTPVFSLPDVVDKNSVPAVSDTHAPLQAYIRLSALAHWVGLSGG